MYKKNELCVTFILTNPYRFNVTKTPITSEHRRFNNFFHRVFFSFLQQLYSTDTGESIIVSKCSFILL